MPCEPICGAWDVDVGSSLADLKRKPCELPCLVVATIPVLAETGGRQFPEIEEPEIPTTSEWSREGGCVSKCATSEASRYKAIHCDNVLFMSSSQRFFFFFVHSHLRKCFPKPQILRIRRPRTPGFGIELRPPSRQHLRLRLRLRLRFRLRCSVRDSRRPAVFRASFSVASSGCGERSESRRGLY